MRCVATWVAVAWAAAVAVAIRCVAIWVAVAWAAAVAVAIRCVAILGSRGLGRRSRGCDLLHNDLSCRRLGGSRGNALRGDLGSRRLRGSRGNSLRGDLRGSGSCGPGSSYAGAVAFCGSGRAGD